MFEKLLAGIFILLTYLVTSYFGTFETKADNNKKIFEVRKMIIKQDNKINGKLDKLICFHEKSSCFK